MQEEKRWISSKILVEAITEELAAKRRAVFTVTGMSMWPFLCHGRDQVIAETVDVRHLKVGDIVLFRTDEDRYILHRITRRTPGSFETTGDGNLYRDGRFLDTCIVAKINSVIRKGKKISCDNFMWKLLSNIWLRLFPIRKDIVVLWSYVRRYVKK